MKPGEPGLEAVGAMMFGDARGVLAKPSGVGVIGDGSVTSTGGTVSCDWEMSRAKGVAGALMSGSYSSSSSSEVSPSSSYCGPPWLDRMVPTPSVYIRVNKA